MKKTLEFYRTILRARQATLHEVDAISLQARQPVSLDQTRIGRLSRMDALQGQAMANATTERRVQEQKRIVAALDRLESGVFGDCLNCGDEIAQGRLESDPTTLICIACARK